jgi:hypothetical protein
VPGSPIRAWRCGNGLCRAYWCGIGLWRGARCGNGLWRGARCENGLWRGARYGIEWGRVVRRSDRRYARAMEIRSCPGQCSGRRPCPRTGVRYWRTLVDPRPPCLRWVESTAVARSVCCPRLNLHPCAGARRGRCGYLGRCFGSRCCGFWRCRFRRCGFRRRTTGLLPGELPPARVAEPRGAYHRLRADEQSGVYRRRWSPGILRRPAGERCGGFHRTRAGERCGGHHQLPVSGDYAARRHRSRRRGPRRRDRYAVPARYGRRSSGPGRSPRSRWSRSVAGFSAGSSMFRRQHEPSSGHRGRRQCDRRRLPLGPWAFRVPQPRQPTSSICHHRTQTNEEGRSTSSGATLFTYVRRRPTLPRGPPRSTIGAEGLNFRVRNGTGCFPFAITAETLLRCHRPSSVKRACCDRISGTAQWTRNQKSRSQATRPISTGQLHTLPCFHLRPINPVV